MKNLVTPILENNNENLLQLPYNYIVSSERELDEKAIASALRIKKEGDKLGKKPEEIIWDTIYQKQFRDSKARDLVILYDKNGKKIDPNNLDATSCAIISKNINTNVSLEGMNLTMKDGSPLEIGRADNMISNYQEVLKQMINNQESIKLTLIALPAKITFGRTSPDMGEFWMINQLHRIIKSINAIYSNGAHFQILTEGEVFGPLLGMQDKHYQIYRDEIIKMAKKMGVSDNFHFSTLKEVISKYPGEDTFWKKFAENSTSFDDTKFSEKEKSRWVSILERISNGGNLTDYNLNDAIKIYENFGKTRSDFQVPANGGDFGLYITVTSGKPRFCIHMVQEGCQYFPHMGLSVFDEKGKHRIYPVSDEEMVTFKDIQPLYIPEFQNSQFDGTSHPFGYFYPQKVLIGKN